MTTDHQLNELIETYLAQRARAAIHDAPTLDEAVARVAARLPRRTSGSLILLIAAALLLAAFLGAAVAVGSGLLRLPFVDGPSSMAPGAFVVQGAGSDVLVHDIKSGQVRKVATAAGDIVAMEHSPDRKALAFLSRTSSGLSTTLWVADVDGTAAHELPGWLFGAYQLAWSPDGRRIAVPSNGAVLLIDPSGRDESVRLPVGSITADEVEWHPSGRSLFVLDSTGGTFLEASVDGGEVREVLPVESRGLLGGPPSTHGSVAVSPDGRFVAVTSSSGLRVVDLDTREVHERSVDGYEALPTFSPDGRSLAAMHVSELGDLRVVIGPPLGPPVVVTDPLPPHGLTRRLVFSPDSSRVLVLPGESEGPEQVAWLVDVETGEREEVAWAHRPTPAVAWPPAN